MIKDNDKIDYRYVTEDSARDFHSARRAFVIYNGEILFIEEGNSMSHWEFCKERIPNINENEFNQLTRGYYLNGDLVFYKDNFIYDDQVIEEALNYIDIIKKECHVERVKIYFGLIVGKSGEKWPFDYYYNDMYKSLKMK